jgi:hypothetical protein
MFLNFYIDFCTTLIYDDEGIDENIFNLMDLLKMDIFSKTQKKWFVRIKLLGIMSLWSAQIIFFPLLSIAFCPSSSQELRSY